MRADGGTQDDVAHDVAYLSDGTSVVVGSFEGVAVFGDGEARETTLTSGGRARRLPRALQRQRRPARGDDIARGPLDDDAFGVVALADRSWYVVGAFAGQAVFGAGETNETTLTAAGGQDAFLARYFPDGRLSWVRAVGGPFDDVFLDATGDGDGLVAVAGSFGGTVVLGEGESQETELVSAGLSDALVAVYDASGSLRWAASGGGTDRDVYRSLTAWPGGELLAVGSFRETATFGSTILVAAGAQDGVLVRYRAGGRFDWAEGIQGPGDVVPRAAAVFENGECAVTGSFEGEAIFGLGESGEIRLESSGGDQDLFLARYTRSGDLDWAKRAGGAGQGDGAEGVSIQPYDDGTCLLIGTFRGQAFFGPGELDETRLDAAGGTDLFFARYERGGALRWAFGDGGSGDEAAAATVFMVDGSLLVTGSFSGTAALDPSGGGAIVLPSEGERDPFLGRYDVDE